MGSTRVFGRPPSGSAPGGDIFQATDPACPWKIPFATRLANRPSDPVSTREQAGRFHLKDPRTIRRAEHSQQVDRNLADIEAMVARREVLPFDNLAACHFGQIRAELYRAGNPIGAYDMMIAGHARANGLTLITNNTKEFECVPGLVIEDWSES